MSRLAALAALAALGAAAPACGGKSGPTEAPTPAPLPAAPPLVQGYDDLRAALAEDDLPRAQRTATAYATTVRDEPPGPMDAAALARLGEGLDAVNAAADLDTARRAFGLTSEGFLQLVAARPSLKAGLYAFRCPMAPGYKLWVQREKTMRNPYMGRAMLACGAEVELKP